MRDMPESFIKRTRQLMGGGRFSRFLQAMNDNPVVSIRVNPFKTTTAIPAAEWETVPWCPEGYYLHDRPDFTLDPLLHAGAYYVQDASSMFITNVIRSIRCSAKEMKNILDLCAAPGGKTTAIRSVLPEDCRLWANEPDGRRARILLENVIKFGHEGVSVTQARAKDFQYAGMMFDVILVDAPCSGEGMFRKDSQSIRQWSIANVKMCRRRQREILTDIWSCMKPGGYLIYSTCTYNTEENEEQLLWMMNTYGAKPVEIPVDERWGVTGSLLEGFTAPVYRFIPGMTRGEGLTLWVATTAGSDRPLQKPTKGWSANKKPLLSTVVTDPLHTEVMNRHFDRKKYPAVELCRNDALRFLRHESLVLPPGMPAGTVVVTYRALPLGYVNNIGTRANNKYPSNWRIRKMI